MTNAKHSKAFVRVAADVLRDRELSANAKLLYSYLLNKENMNGPWFSLSREQMALDVGLGSTKTVDRIILELQAFGLLKTPKRIGLRKCNKYALIPYVCE